MNKERPRCRYVGKCNSDRCPCRSSRILFLDMDGVLNNRESMSRPGRASAFQVNADCCRRLRDVVEDLGILLVLSSTWRLGGGVTGKGLGVWRAKDAIFHAIGWGAPFIGTTVDGYREELCGSEFVSRRLRGEECNEWIGRLGQRGDVYVAVDDDGDFETFKGTLIRTEHEPGLTDADVERIRQAFGAVATS